MNIKIELTNLKGSENNFNKELISPELDNYIVNSCEQNFWKRKTITLEIYGLNDVKEQEEFQKKLHSYYEKRKNYFNKIEKVDDYFRVILLIIGIILIILSEHLISFLSELFLIAGWVVIWEIIYDIFFNELKRKQKNNIYKELSKCKINFNKIN